MTEVLLPFGLVLVTVWGELSVMIKALCLGYNGPRTLRNSTPDCNVAPKQPIEKESHREHDEYFQNYLTAASDK